MNYKIEETVKKSKMVLIIAPIIWLILVIEFIMPMTCAIYAGSLSGKFNSTNFTNVFGIAASHPMNGFSKIFKYKLFGKFIKSTLGFSLIYLLFILISFWKNAPKHRYDGTEHGSSDWSEHGEQYQILSKKEGIILSEGNYLPIDKRGNVNVLVVGRIRFW